MKNVCLLETSGTLYMAPATVTELIFFFFFFLRQHGLERKREDIEHRAVIPLAFLTQAFQRLPGTK